MAGEGEPQAPCAPVSSLSSYCFPERDLPDPKAGDYLPRAQPEAVHPPNWVLYSALEGPSGAERLSDRRQRRDAAAPEGGRTSPGKARPDSPRPRVPSAPTTGPSPACRPSSHLPPPEKGPSHCPYWQTVGPRSALPCRQPPAGTDGHLQGEAFRTPCRTPR